MLFRKKYNPEEQLMKIFNEHQGKIIIDGWDCLVGIAHNGGYIIPGIKHKITVDIPPEVWKRLLEHFNITGDPEVLYFESEDKVHPLTREEAKKLLLSKS
jgi:hypothetical protein